MKKTYIKRELELLYICPKGIKNIAGSDNEKYSANKVKKF